jgi:hypothetical protein
MRHQLLIPAAAAAVESCWDQKVQLLLLLLLLCQLLHCLGYHCQY